MFISPNITCHLKQIWNRKVIWGKHVRDVSFAGLPVSPLLDLKQSEIRNLVFVVFITGTRAISSCFWTDNDEYRASLLCITLYQFHGDCWSTHGSCSQGPSHWQPLFLLFLTTLTITYSSAVSLLISITVAEKSVFEGCFLHLRSSLLGSGSRSVPVISRVFCESKPNQEAALNH